MLGSLVFARSLRRPLGAMLSAGTFAIGLAYVGFAAAPSLGLACVAALIGGVGNGVELPSLISIVQRLTPQHLHGRLMGAVESLGALCLAIGLPLGGALVALSSPRVAFLVVGLGDGGDLGRVASPLATGTETAADDEELRPRREPAGELRELSPHESARRASRQAARIGRQHEAPSAP